MEEIMEKLVRFNSKALDEILGKPFKVLDDGFVRVVDYMGTDSSIVQAARVSYGKGTKKVSRDRELIRYLLRHQHTSPFEMCSIKLHVRVPMDCWRQWIRHRTASVNEYSTRYSIAINAAQKTAPDAWRGQSAVNHQGSAGLIDPEIGREFSQQESELHQLARQVYSKRLEAGVAREQARKDLPLCTYTEAYWKIDLHNLLHFLKLRMESNAQKEIRDYALTIGHEIVSRWVPVTWEAFNDYVMKSIQFSRLEREILACLLRGLPEAALEKAESFGWLVRDAQGILKKKQERYEFEEKMRTMNITLPWEKNSI
ncbi:MAG: FAD-dependent thymidylate synthase [Candidatus Marinimicrobia bacterium]|nr:FAD-dependent thymidylate synthase [Candidatus Neomarinimicrobiota bacterium]